MPLPPMVRPHPQFQCPRTDLGNYTRSAIGSKTSFSPLFSTFHYVATKTDNEVSYRNATTCFVYFTTKLTDLDCGLDWGELERAPH